jgi:hypothetical protein
MTASIENAEWRPRVGRTFRGLTSEFDVVLGRPLVGQKQEQAKSRTNAYMGPEGVDINPFRETPARETADVSDAIGF